MENIHLLIINYYNVGKMVVEAIPFKHKSSAVVEMHKVFNKLFKETKHEIVFEDDLNIIVRGKHGIAMELELTITESEVR